MFANAQSLMEEHMVRAPLPPSYQPRWLYNAGAPIFRNHEWGERYEINEWEYEMTWREWIEKWRMMMDVIGKTGVSREKIHKSRHCPPQLSLGDVQTRTREPSRDRGMPLVYLDVLVYLQHPY